MAHRIVFADGPETPERWSGGWVDVHEYLTVAQRQRIDNAGMAFELDPAKIREVLEGLGDGATASHLTPSQLAEAASLRLDLTASEFAEVREAVIAYSLTGAGEPKRGGQSFPDELPEALEWVLGEIKAYYEGQRRTPAARKSPRTGV